MFPPPASSPSPRGPVLRASLRANAAPFTPAKSSSSTSSTGYVEVVHNSVASSGSQPVIQRRHSQNPTFHAGKKRMSMHGNIGSGRRTRVAQPADQNAAPANNNNPTPKNKVEAKSFASDAFKKNAAKAYLAKKRAQETANANNAIISIGNKKDDARKAFARRQSQKLLRRQAAEDCNKRIDQHLELEAKQQQNTQSSTTSTTATTSTTTTSTATAQIVADVCNISTSSLTSSRPTSITSSASVDPPVLSGINLTSDEDELISKSDVISNTNDSAANVDINDANISHVSITDAPIEQPVSNSTTTTNNTNSNSTPSTAPGLSININAVNSSSIEPITATVPKSAPVVPITPILVPSNSMSILPSCSVDIAQLPRGSVSQAMSSCTMSTVSGGSSFDGCTSTGKRGKQTAMMPSSGKWCDECAGVGLHIAAMMTTISGWRAEEERRSSNTSTSGKTTSSSSGGGWKRRMSQTLIGVSHTSHASSKTPSDVQREKQRLEQQVDVLTLTVQFLYERLQKQGAATADVTDAVRRCT